MLLINNRMIPIGSKVRVNGYTEIHTITAIVGGYGYITSYTRVYDGRTVLMENLYVPVSFVSVI